MTQQSDFEKYVRQAFRMRQITRNQLVNTYWSHIEEIERLGFVAFVIRGSLAWKAETKRQIFSQMNYVWLKSDYYDPIGKSIFSEPVKIYLQQHLNQYDIWGGIKVQVDNQNAETTKESLEQAIRDISLLCNLASLTTRASLTWLPARYTEVNVIEGIPDKSITKETSSHKEWVCIPLPRQQEEQTSVLVNDDYIERELFPLFDAILRVGYDEVAALFRRSIAWHSIGNFLGSGLNRFLNYWEAVELLAHYFFRKFPAEVTKRPTRSERKAQILDIMTKEPITLANCLAIADKCAGIMQSSIRTEMQSVIPILMGASDFAEKFFEPDDITHRSLYDIRNDIAHGNYCDHDLEFTELVEQRLDDMFVYSEAVIVAAVQRLEAIKLLINS